MMNRRNFVAGTAAMAGLSGFPMAAYAEDAPVISEMVLGDENAPVTVIEYASYTCPHCASFHKNVFKDLKADYIDTGKIKFIYREVYWDKPAVWASIMARCSGEMKFFGITELLFEKQKEWATANSSREIYSNLRKIGLSAGLTKEELDACFTDEVGSQALYNWGKENEKNDDITGTPSFIINGDKHGNMNYADFSKLLDEYLEG